MEEIEPFPEYLAYAKPRIVEELGEDFGYFDQLTMNDYMPG